MSPETTKMFSMQMLVNKLIHFDSRWRKRMKKPFFFFKGIEKRKRKKKKMKIYKMPLHVLAHYTKVKSQRVFD